jgi:hypothetical protein
MMTNEELRGAVAKAADDAGIQLEVVGYRVSAGTGDIKVRIVKGDVVQCAYMDTFLKEHIPLCMNVHVESGDLAGWNRLGPEPKFQIGDRIFLDIDGVVRRGVVGSVTPDSGGFIRGTLDGGVEWAAQPSALHSGHWHVHTPVMETLGNEGPPPIQVIERAKGLTLDHLAKAEGLVRSDGEADGSLRWRLTETLKATQAPPSAYNSDTFRQDLARVFGLAADAPDDVLLSTAEKVWGGYRKEDSTQWLSACEARHESSVLRTRHNALADRCGDLEHENKRLRAMLGERLTDEAIRDEVTIAGVKSPGRVHHFK